MSKKGYEKNKEFYDKYIRDDRTEDEKMMEIIHENARKKKNDKDIKKNNKIKNWGIYVSLAVVFIIIGVLIGVLWVK